MRRKKLWKMAFVSLIAVLLVGGTSFGAILWSIEQSVQENCQVAQQAAPHPGDDVSALIVYMQSSEHSSHEQIHQAAWIPERLQNPKALSALQASCLCQGRNQSSGLSQHELKKAIRRCGGEFAVGSGGPTSI